MFNHKVYRKRIDHSVYPDELIHEIESKIDFLNIKEELAKKHSSAKSENPESQMFQEA